LPHPTNIEAIMSLIDQATGQEAAVEPAVAIYRKSARGIVCKVVPLTHGFVVPEGWEATPTAAGRDGDEPILQANCDDEPFEPPAPKKAKKVTE
jgi:hypothetical protein